MSLLYNTVSKFIRAFLPRSNRLSVSWLQSPSAVILNPKKIVSVTVYNFSPSICHDIMGPHVITLVFWMLSFKSVVLLSFFTLIKRLFNSSSFSAIRVVSSAYLRLLIFLPPILIPGYNSSSPLFLMMCLVYKLNKQGDSRQPCHIPFSILNQSVVPYRVLTVASLPTSGFSGDR